LKDEYHLIRGETHAIPKTQILELLLDEGLTEAAVGLWMDLLSSLVSSVLTAAADVVMPHEQLGGGEPSEEERAMHGRFAGQSRADLVSMFQFLTDWQSRPPDQHSEFAAHLVRTEIMEKSVVHIERSIKETEWPTKLREMLMEIWNDPDGKIFAEARLRAEASHQRQQRLRDIDG